MRLKTLVLTFGVAGALGMTPIEFENVVVASPAPGEFLVALFDGAQKLGTPHECVALLSCSAATAQLVVKVLNSALKGSKT